MDSKPVRIRLSPFEVNAISSTFKLFFEPEDHLWLFGSRTRPEARGGDIDLYIETTISNIALANSKKNHFLIELYITIGDQKIDVVLNNFSDSHELPIYAIAKKEGIQLV